MRALPLLAAATCLFAAGTLHAHDASHSDPVAPWQQASAWPDRIIATFEADPARSLAISWRTHGDVKSTRAEIARAIPDARFDLAAQSEPAETVRLSL